MADYSWRGTDERGREQRGRCEAAGPAQAAALLRARGLAPLSMERSGDDPAPQFSVTADAFTLFNRNLAEMTAVGLPLPQAIREVAAGLRGGRFKRGLEQIEAALGEGKTLDQAVAELPGVFPPYYESMLKAGAASGNLPAMLSAVARNTEGIRLARRAFAEALMYPLSIVVAALALGVGMAALLIPFYRELSAARGFDAPGLDHVLRAFGSNGVLIAAFAGAVLAAGIGAWAIARTAWGERLVAALPFVGRIRRHLQSARLLGALGVLLRTGVPLPRALPVALGAAASRVLDGATPDLVRHSVEGRGLGDVLGRMPVIPSEVAALLAVAERSGDAPQVAAKVSEVLTEQARSDSEALFVILVPVALLVAGTIVGGFLTSIVLPYRQFLESLIR